MREQFYEREEVITDRGLFGGEEIVEREEYVARDTFGRERVIEHEEVVESPGLLGELFGERETVREEIIERDYF